MFIGDYTACQAGSAVVSPEGLKAQFCKLCALQHCQEGPNVLTALKVSRGLYKCACSANVIFSGNLSVISP